MKWEFHSPSQGGLQASLLSGQMLGFLGQVTNLIARLTGFLHGLLLVAKLFQHALDSSLAQS